LFIENIPVNIKQQHETCQKMFVANADGCQVMCRWGIAEDRTI